jgi:hypothetical protein
MKTENPSENGRNTTIPPEAPKARCYHRSLSAAPDLGRGVAVCLDCGTLARIAGADGGPRPLLPGEAEAWAMMGLRGALRILLGNMRAHSSTSTWPTEITESMRRAEDALNAASGLKEPEPEPEITTCEQCREGCYDYRQGRDGRKLCITCAGPVYLRECLLDAMRALLCMSNVPTHRGTWVFGFLGGIAGLSDLEQSSLGTLLEDDRSDP